jgi:hemoglobin
MTAIRRVCLSLVVLVSLPAVSAWAQDAAKPKTLYQRLGGYDAIAAVVDDFLPRLGKDPAIAPLLTGLSLDHKKRNRQLLIEFVCEATGGPCIYTGRTMQSAHAGLGITGEQFKLAGGHMIETLDKFKVGEPERSELMGMIGKLAPDIVETPKPAPGAQQ